MSVIQWFRDFLGNTKNEKGEIEKLTIYQDCKKEYEQIKRADEAGTYKVKVREE